MPPKNSRFLLSLLSHAFTMVTRKLVRLAKPQPLVSFLKHEAEREQGCWIHFSFVVVMWAHSQGTKSTMVVECRLGRRAFVISVLGICEEISLSSLPHNKLTCYRLQTGLRLSCEMSGEWMEKWRLTITSHSSIYIVPLIFPGIHSHEDRMITLQMRK